MNLSRRCFLASAALAAPAVYDAVSSHALAQNLAGRPFRLIVTVSAGGAADATARLLGSKVAAKWGQPVVIENRVGATGMIGAEMVAKSSPDGLTALFASTSLVQAPALFPDAPYDVARDFAPVSQVAGLAVVLVVGESSPFHSLAEYLAAAQDQKRTVTYGSMGMGSSLHIFGATLARDAKVNLIHVPFKGEAPALNDVVGGHVDSCFASVASAAPLIAAGKVRPLAVVGDKRVPTLPNVPTLVELGFPNLNILGWYGVLVPASTPKPRVAKLSADFAAVIKEPEVAKIILDGGNTPVGSTPDEFAALLAADSAKWRRLIQEAGIKPPA